MTPRWKVWFLIVGWFLLGIVWGLALAQWFPRLVAR